MELEIKFPVYLRMKNKPSFIMIKENGDFMEIGENSENCTVYAIFGNRQYNEGLGMSEKNFLKDTERLIKVNNIINEDIFNSKVQQWEEEMGRFNNGDMLTRYSQGEKCFKDIQIESAPPPGFEPDYLDYDKEEKTPF